MLGSVKQPFYTPIKWLKHLSQEPKTVDSKFIGPRQIRKRIEFVAYKVILPPLLANIITMFCVSQLRKCLHYSNHVISSKSMQVKEELSLEMNQLKF